MSDIKAPAQPYRGPCEEPIKVEPVVMPAEAPVPVVIPAPVPVPAHPLKAGWSG
jgi:hypothetical protein